MTANALKNALELVIWYNISDKMIIETKLEIENEGQEVANIS